MQREGEILNNRISFDNETTWGEEIGNEQINFRFNNGSPTPMNEISSFFFEVLLSL